VVADQNGNPVGPAATPATAAPEEPLQEITVTAQKDPVTYTVAQGDSYARIAREQYGDERYAALVMQANGIDPTYGNVHGLQIGAELTLPDLSTLGTGDLASARRQGGTLLGADQAVTDELAAAKSKVDTVQAEQGDAGVGIDPRTGLRAGPTIENAVALGLTSQSAAFGASGSGEGDSHSSTHEGLSSLSYADSLYEGGVFGLRLYNSQLVTNSIRIVDQTSLLSLSNADSSVNLFRDSSYVDNLGSTGKNVFESKGPFGIFRDLEIPTSSVSTTSETTGRVSAAIAGESTAIAAQAETVTTVVESAARNEAAAKALHKFFANPLTGGAIEVAIGALEDRNLVLTPVDKTVRAILDFGAGTANSFVSDVAGGTAAAGVTALAIETGPAAPVIGGAAGVGTVIGTNLLLSKGYSYVREPIANTISSGINATINSYTVTVDYLQSLIGH
jgi:LysM repeat protein